MLKRRVSDVPPPSPSASIEADDRRLTEERLRRSNLVLEGINRIFHVALSQPSEEEWRKLCLAVAEDVSGAAFSFMGEVDHAAQRLGDLTISDRGWAAFAIEDPAFPLGRTPTGLRLAGLNGRVIADETSVIANDPDNHPDRIGVPRGHPPLTAFLGVPLKHRGVTIGLIGLANRQHGFRRVDAEAVERLAPAIVHALTARRAIDARLADREARAERIERSHEADARFRLFAEHSSHLLWIVDPADGTIGYRSPAFERIWGEPAADGPPTMDVWLDGIHPDDRNRVRAWYDAAVGGESRPVEYRIVRRDGVTRWLRDTAFPIRDEGGRIVWIGGMAEDLTRDDVTQVYLVAAQDAEGRRLSRMLRELGFRVRAFSDPDQFLDVSGVLAPGCVVVDLRRARRAALRIPRELRARSVALPVVAIGPRDAGIPHVVETMKTGALDYLIDPPTSENLRVAIVEAMAAPQDAEGSEAADDLAAAARVARLTPREHEVLVGLVAGGTNKSIALDLGISPRTVELHRAQAMSRLNVTSLTELLQVALRAGIQAPDPAARRSRNPT
jgi:PAS domain S-box-containing protein